MALVHISQVKNGPRRERQNKQMFILMVKDSMRGSRGGGGAGGPDPPPPWNLKILPKKGNFRIFLGGWTPLVCDQTLPFSLDPLS